MLEILSDLFRYRELVWLLFLRDLKAQFRQSLLGYAWLLLPPVLTTLVWVFLTRQEVVSFATPGMPYPVFVVVGTVVWQTFVRLIQMPLLTFDAGKTVFTKLRVPPEVFVAAGVLRAMFDSALYCALLIPVMWSFGVRPSAAAPLFALVMLSLVAFGTALGLMMIPLGSLYSDFKHGLPVLMGLLLYLAPVVYAPPAAGIASTVMRWNPMTPILMGARGVLVTGSLQHLGAILGILIASLFVALGCLAALRVVMPHLVARMGA